MPEGRRKKLAEVLTKHTWLAEAKPGREFWLIDDKQHPEEYTLLPSRGSHKYCRRSWPSQRYMAWGGSSSKTCVQNAIILRKLWIMHTPQTSFFFSKKSISCHLLMTFMWKILIAMLLMVYSLWSKANESKGIGYYLPIQLMKDLFCQTLTKEFCSLLHLIVESKHSYEEEHIKTKLCSFLAAPLATVLLNFIPFKAGSQKTKLSLCMSREHKMGINFRNAVTPTSQTLGSLLISPDSVYGFFSIPKLPAATTSQLELVCEM